MNKTLILSATLVGLAVFASSALSAPLTIAVIDTGIDYSSEHLCLYGHKSFSLSSDDALKDTNGHGTHIAGLINKYAGKGSWCIISIKFYDEKASGSQNLNSLKLAMLYAVSLKVDIINLSGGGAVFDSVEKAIILQALNNGIKINVAAGNNGDNLDAECNYYPACYDKRIATVGNLSTNHSVALSSNYGKYVKLWEVGTDVESTLPGHKRGVMTGTSQATAIYSGKMIFQALHK